MGRLNKDQKGFSILELVIAIALAGLITAAITMTVFQVFAMNTRTANRMTAVSQVQHAGKIVSEDILEAQADKIDDTPEGDFLILGWSAQNSTEIHDIVYTLDGTELWRSESIDGGDPVMTRVAEYINPDQTSCIWADGVLTFTVTATVGDESETRVYEVRPRPESQ
jgi:prepilin-type N-terminal cleavage/methylation domain-containing protein